jgi:protein phosphatase
LLRRGRIQQLTRDHSIVQEQLERGAITREQARHALNRNVLTRAVGIDPVVSADVRSAAAEPGDVFLLCSDGLTDMLSDDAIASVLRSFEADPATAANRLVDAANDAGGFDNISVIVGRIPTDESEP